MIIHGDKLRWLLWLRWRTLIRGFVRGGVAQIAGGVLQILFSVLFMGVMAIFTFILYRTTSAPVNAEILFLVLTILYGIWIVLPLFDISRNEGLDLSKLELFPLTRGELIISLLLSTLLDVPMIGLLLVLAAVVGGWAFSFPLILITILTMLVFAVQLIGISQFIVALFQGILHQRRFRDFSIIISFVFLLLIYMGQFAIRALASNGFQQGIQEGTFSNYLQWLPPGIAARTIQQASVGNWGTSLLWLLVLAVLDIVVLYLWLVFTQRSLTATENGGSIRGASGKSAQASRITTPARTYTGTTSNWGGFLPMPMREIMVKDLKYLRRDPQITKMFLQSLVIIAFYVVYFGISNFSSSGSSASLSSQIGPWSVIAAPALVLISLFILTYNVLGFERQSLTTLFLFPIAPKYILWGKNLVAFTIGLVEMIIIVILAAAFTNGWSFVLPALAVGIAGMAIQIGMGNFTSVFFPQKMRFERRRFSGTSSFTGGAGCLRAFLSGLAFYATLFMLIPVALAIILPVIFGTQWIWAITIPATLLYGGIIYYGITALVAPRILSKAPEILNVIAKEA